MVEHRTEALAIVSLTRRSDARPIKFEMGPMDLFLQFLTENDAPFIPLMGVGVCLAGTVEPLPTIRAAEQFVNRKWLPRKHQPYRYYFPVIGLVFSMENDKGYYTWLAKPLLDTEKTHPALFSASRLECGVFNHEALNKIVEETRSWYSVVDETLFLKCTTAEE